MTTYIMLGCGALGSQIAMHLASPDNKFVLVDDDTVDENNVITRTSAYNYYHIGAQKTIVLSEMLWHKARSITIPVNQTMTRSNLLNVIHQNTEGSESRIVVDTFDNMESRSITTILYPLLPVLHVGVSLQRTGSILWDNNFQFGVIVPRGENAVCTNQLGAHILSLASILASMELDRFASTGQKRNFFVSTSLQIRELGI